MKALRIAPTLLLLLACTNSVEPLAASGSLNGVVAGQSFTWSVANTRLVAEDDPMAATQGSGSCLWEIRGEQTAVTVSLVAPRNAASPGPSSLRILPDRTDAGQPPAIWLTIDGTPYGNSGCPGIVTTRNLVDYTTQIDITDCELVSASGPATVSGSFVFTGCTEL